MATTSTAPDTRAAPWGERESFFPAYDPHASSSWRAPPEANNTLSYPTFTPSYRNAPQPSARDHTFSQPQQHQSQQQHMYASSSYPPSNDTRYSSSPVVIRDVLAPESRFAPSYGTHPPASYPTSSPPQHVSQSAMYSNGPLTGHLPQQQQQQQHHSSSSSSSSSSPPFSASNPVAPPVPAPLSDSFAREPIQSGSSPHQQRTPPPAAVDFDQLLRSYDYILNNLPSPERWVNGQTRQQDSGKLTQLLSTAVTALRTLNPNATLEPPRALSRAANAAPSSIGASTASAMNTPSPVPVAGAGGPGESAADQTIYRHKRRRPIQKCLSCQSTSTPEWRKGPLGPRTLCNACGLVYAKILKKRNAAEAQMQHKQTTGSAPSKKTTTNASTAPKGQMHVQVLPPVTFPPEGGSSNSGQARRPSKKARTSSMATAGAATIAAISASAEGGIVGAD